MLFSTRDAFRNLFLWNRQALSVILWGLFCGTLLLAHLIQTLFCTKTRVRISLHKELINIRAVQMETLRLNIRAEISFFCQGSIWIHHRPFIVVNTNASKHCQQCLGGPFHQS